MPQEALQWVCCGVQSNRFDWKGCKGVSRDGRGGFPWVFCERLNIWSEKRGIWRSKFLLFACQVILPGHKVCLLTFKWFCACLIVRLILSPFHFQQDDVQLWLSHVAFCKQWVSVQSLNLAWVQLLDWCLSRHLELELQGKATKSLLPHAVILKWFW